MLERNAERNIAWCVEMNWIRKASNLLLDDFREGQAWTTDAGISGGKGA